MRLLSKEEEPPSATFSDKEALRDFQRSDKAKRLCLENEKRQTDLVWWTNLRVLKKEEKKKQKADAQADAQAMASKLKEEKEKLRTLKKEEEKKLKEEQAKLRALKKEEEKAKQKADAQADAQAMASKVKATLEEPGMMQTCIDSITSSPYDDLQRGKVG